MKNENTEEIRHTFTPDFISRCLSPLKTFLQSRVRVILRVPNLQFQYNREEPLVDYAVGHKYLITLDRLMFRET